jgi:hypothetical protein
MNHEYPTSDLASASYAIAVGQQLLRMDFRNPKRVVFCFRDTPELRRVIEDFWNGRARVEPLHLMQTQKLLKQRIYAHQQP